MPRKRKRTEGKEVPLDSDDDEWKLESKEGKEEPIKEPIEVKEEEIEEEKPKKKRKRIVPEHKQLWKRFPDVFKQLDPAKNVGVDLRNLSYASHQVLTWTCLVHETCKEHEWKAAVKTRTIGKSGCPFCCARGLSIKQCKCVRPSYKNADGSTKKGQENMKRCGNSKCKEEKLLSEFQSSKRTKDLLTNFCKECLNKKNRERSDINYTMRRIYFQGKSCVDCNETDDMLFECDHVNDDKAKTKDGKPKPMADLSPDNLCLELKKIDIVCIECHRIRTLLRNPLDPSKAKDCHIENEELVKKLKLERKKCNICDNKITEKNYRTFDFDHIDPSTKLMRIAQMNHDSSPEDIVTEIEKCQAVCCKCHRRKTAIDFKWRKLSDMSQESIDQSNTNLDKYFQKNIKGNYIHIRPTKI